MNPGRHLPSVSVETVYERVDIEIDVKSEKLEKRFKKILPYVFRNLKRRKVIKLLKLRYWASIQCLMQVTFWLSSY